MDRDGGRRWPGGQGQAGHAWPAILWAQYEVGNVQVIEQFPSKTHIHLKPK